MKEIFYDNIHLTSCSEHFAKKNEIPQSRNSIISGVLKIYSIIESVITVVKLKTYPVNLQ